MVNVINKLSGLFLTFQGLVWTIVSSSFLIYRSIHNILADFPDFFDISFISKYLDWFWFFRLSPVLYWFIPDLCGVFPTFQVDSPLFRVRSWLFWVFLMFPSYSWGFSGSSWFFSFIPNCSGFGLNFHANTWIFWVSPNVQPCLLKLAPDFFQVYQWLFWSIPNFSVHFLEWLHRLFKVITEFWGLFLNQDYILLWPG